jgi:hypothetical protein
MHTAVDRTNLSALTQISEGKYSFSLQFWAVFNLPYNKWTETFATSDARSSATLKVSNTSLADIHGGDVCNAHRWSPRKRDRRTYRTYF